MSELPAAVGVIGGSGLYQISGLIKPQEIEINTPFGKPSDPIVGGKLAGKQIYFLPRHGRGHRILPTELNHRANVFALRLLNVRWLISIGAVGSLQPQYHPRDILLPSQFFDRTSQRADCTFFGEGIVAHVALADPVSARLRKIIADAARSLGYSVHDGGTYVNMDGPAFSTRAESEFHRKMGFDVVGMTNLPEAKLAREAEMAFASISLVTDYDCWKTDDEPVTAQTVVEHLMANAEAAKRIIPPLVEQISDEPNWPEHRALDTALITDRKLWPRETVKKLEVILKRFL
jgi:5'-methylthioadenosine phosphorylase